MAGNWEEDLICCLTMQMMNRMKTRTSDTSAKTEGWRCHLRSIKAQNGEALSFVDLFAEKESQEEMTLLQKGDVLEKEFIVDIKRRARQRRLEAATTFHR